MNYTHQTYAIAAFCSKLEKTLFTEIDVQNNERQFNSTPFEKTVKEIICCLLLGKGEESITLANSITCSYSESEYFSEFKKLNNAIAIKNFLLPTAILIDHMFSPDKPIISAGIVDDSFSEKIYLSRGQYGISDSILINQFLNIDISDSSELDENDKCILDYMIAKKITQNQFSIQGRPAVAPVSL